MAFDKNEEFWINTWRKMKVVQFRGVRYRIRKDEEYRRRLSGYITNNANYLRASAYWWLKYVRYAFLLDRALSNAEVAGDKAVAPSSDTEDIASDDPEKKVILKKRKRIRRDNGRFARTRLSALGTSGDTTLGRPLTLWMLTTALHQMKPE